MAKTMFINPLLAMALEASLLDRDLIDAVGIEKAVDMRKRLFRVMELARRVPGIELPLAVCVEALSEAIPPPSKDHKFPVIQGGKQ